MKFAEITGWGKCLPPAVMTNDDLSTFLDTSDEWISSRTGIRQRRVTHVPTSMLASIASKRALAAAGIDGSEIDLIILASATPDTLIPNIASTVQKEIGAVNAGAFDINAACSGFLYGLNMATSLIQAGPMNKILVVGAERLTWFLNWDERDTAVLFGDGAGAAVVEATDKELGVLGYALGNDPNGIETLKVNGYGTNMDRTSPDATKFDIQFEGREIFKRAVPGMIRASHTALERAGKSLDEVNLLIPHQANQRIIEAIVNKLELPEEKAFINIAPYGNTSAATIPIAITDALEKGKINSGDLLLSCAFGAGLTSAASVIRWGDRTTPKDTVDVELPPCEKTALELINKA